MKSKIMIVLCAAVALAGCEQRQDRMNEPAGAERPAYENRAPSTNTQAGRTNQLESPGTKTNGTGSSDKTGTSATP